MQQELVKLYKDSQTYSKKRFQNDDVQDFDVRWNQALVSANETLTDTVLEGLYKSKLQDSTQLHSVLAVYEQQNVRNNEPPNYSRLKTIAKRLLIRQ